MHLVVYFFSMSGEESTETQVAKQKREKKEFLDEGESVKVGSSIFNGLYHFLAREFQCRPAITPLMIAELSTTIVAIISVVAGENNSEYNETLFKGIDEALSKVAMMKVQSAPIETIAQVFKYETIRPKRERPESGDDTPSKKPKKQSSKSSPETLDSEGNVVKQQ